MGGHFKYWVLEVCGRKMGRKSKGDTLWWNEEVKKAVPMKKDAHKAMCWNNTVENMRRYEGMKNKAKKAVLKAMRVKAEEALNEFLKNCPNGMFGLVRGFLSLIF